jgi:exopolyphosphatase/guanosine-5'-triphosphate,3'-diphosphate pyrophosphatase
MARLLEKFHTSDPITLEEIVQLEIYFKNELKELFEKVILYKPEVFIGASGSFDSFVAMLVSEKFLEYKDVGIFHEIPIHIYGQLHQNLLKSTKSDRDNMKGLEPVRRDMIVLASVFVNFVIKELGFQTMYQSAYSLKEGAMLEMINGKI